MNMRARKKTVLSGRFLKFAALFTFAASLCFFVWNAFVVRTVSVEGDGLISENDVLKRIGLPLQGGGKVFLFPGTAARELKKEPWIENVSVKRDYKGSIRIRIKERKPLCLSALPSGSLVYVDGSGRVLGLAPAGRHGMDFPVLRVFGGSVSEGISLLKLSASGLATPRPEEISEVVVSGQDGFRIFTRRGMVVDMGADLKKQWDKFEKMSRSLYARGLAAKYINLRREGVGIVSLK